MKYKRFWEYEDAATVQKAQLLHDENFNNKQKIAAEHAIANTVLTRPTPSILRAIKTVSAVTRSLIQYIQRHDNPSAKLMFDIFFQHVGAMTDQLGRDDSLGEDCRLVSKETARERLLSWLDEILCVSNPTSKQLCSIIRIHVAADYVFFDGLIKSSEHQDTIAWISQQHPELSYKHSSGHHQITHPNVRNEGTICDSRNSTIYKTRGRILRKEEGNEASVLTRQYGLFPFHHEINEEQKLPWHRRGMDWYRAGAKYLVNPRVHNGDYAHSPYVCAAILKDMPLVCSSSTTAARLLRYAAVFSPLTVEEYWHYALVHMAYNILSGHHTFHEMATILRMVGIPYVDGEYLSLFPASGDFLPLRKQLQAANPRIFSEKVSSIIEPDMLAQRLFQAFLKIDETTYEPDCPDFSRHT